MSNLAERLWDSASRHPDRPAIIGEEETYSYGDVVSHVRRVSGGLKAAGISPGDRVLYQVSNGPATTILYFAVLAAGAVAVPISTLLTRAETVRLRARLAAPLFLCEEADRDPDMLVEDVERLELLPDGPEIETPEPRSCVDQAVIFFSSGTTGHPKGILLSHKNVQSNADWVAEESLAPEKWGPGLTTAAVLPLSHSFAMTCMQNAPLLSGASLAYQSRFDTQALLSLIDKRQVTTIALVPSAAAALLNAWKLKAAPLPLEHVLVGGAPIPPDLIAEMESAMQLSVVEGYGLTETSPVCAFRTPQTPRKTGGVGRAAGYATLAVLNDDRGIVSTGDGELVVRGPGVFSGYLDEPAAAEDFFVDGWFRTGDFARIDEDRDVFIVDRLKDLIIRNGYNISPVEIEQVLMSLPGVADAGVIGIPDDRAGEEVAAFVVAQGSAASEAELRNLCEHRLARYKQPGTITFVDSIDRGAKGQVLRDRLRPKS